MVALDECDKKDTKGGSKPRGDPVDHGVRERGCRAFQILLQLLVKLGVVAEERMLSLYNPSC